MGTEWPIKIAQALRLFAKKKTGWLLNNHMVYVTRMLDVDGNILSELTL